MITKHYELIYKNTLNKTYERWSRRYRYRVSELESGKSKGEVVTSIVTVVESYENSEDVKAKEAYDQFMNRVEVSNYTADNFEGENLPEIMPDYKAWVRFWWGK